MTVRNDLSVDWDVSPRIITVASPSTEITIQDLHDTLRDIEDRPDDLTYDYLVDSAGKEPLGGGVYVGITMTLNNAKLAFEARPGPTFVQCNVSGGNLVAFDDVGGEIDPIQTTAYVQVVRTSSSSATLQELESIQYSSYGGGVTVDTTSSYSGTEFPVGTPQEPVNNLVDAMAIATERGFTTLFIMGDITLDSGLDYSQMQIVGESQTRSEITVSASAQVSGSEFYNAYVKGTLDGNAKLMDCLIADLDYVSGIIEQCVLDEGTVLLSGTDALFLDCWCAVPDGTNPPTIDMGGSGTSLAMRNYNGCVKVENKSGADGVSIDLNSGEVELDATVTNGTITIRGVGKLTDNSVGATVVSDNLLQGDAVTADAVWTEAIADHESVSGSVAEVFAFVRDIEGGRWKIDTATNQMIFYAPDNVTEIARFNLFDSDGVPASEDVYERTRV
jgi:hypothetical protein